MPIFFNELTPPPIDPNPDIDPSKLNEYYKNKFYGIYLNPVFPDFHAENYEITETLIKEIEKFHIEYSQCVLKIHIVESVARELFTSNLISYFRKILQAISALSNLKDKMNVVEEFEILANKTAATISGNTNFAVVA